MDDRLDRLISRRSFLRRGACASLGLSGLASQLFTTRMVSAALADSEFDDYKALVCIFLFGGNDSGNTLIPFDGGEQNHDFYASTRGALAIGQDTLANTVIAPTNTSGRRFALHPSLTDMKAMFDAGNLAIVSNVGTLVYPMTKAGWVNQTTPRPRQLFAHNWQQEQWQISTADAVEDFGWGGRVADALQSCGANPNATVSMNISIAGTNVFLAGRQVTPYTVGTNGPISLSVNSLGNSSERAVAAQAFSDLMALQSDTGYSGQHMMQKAYADISQRALVNSDLVDTLLDRPTAIQTTVPDNNRLADQLNMAARLIEHGQQDLNHRRQIFFCSLGGFDNHDGLIGEGEDPGPHANNLAKVNDALKFFWDALGDISMRDRVTTCTSSDFGRTFVSNGNGSDHGWAGHHFVMGGSQVNGGKLYGRFPDLTVGGDDDTGNGRFIPSTSVDEYSFEMARWMGVPLSDMSTVFPNVGRFLDIHDSGTHLGVMA